MADVEGFCDDRFQPLRDLFQANLDTGLDEGGSLAVTLNGDVPNAPAYSVIVR